jgi:hypothetical protein
MERIQDTECYVATNNCIDDSRDCAAGDSLVDVYVRDDAIDASRTN